MAAKLILECNGSCFAKRKMRLSVHVREYQSSQKNSVMPENGKRMCGTNNAEVTHVFYLVAHNESGVFPELVRE